MTRHDEAAGPDRGRGGSGSAYLGRRHTGYNPQRPNRQLAAPECAAAITGAICRALEGLPAEDHQQLMRWIAGRGLLGLARASGFAEAAKVAYRFADQLAVAR